MAFQGALPSELGSLLEMLRFYTLDAEWSVQTEVIIKIFTCEPTPNHADWPRDLRIKPGKSSQLTVCFSSSGVWQSQAGPGMKITAWPQYNRKLDWAQARTEAHWQGYVDRDPVMHLSSFMYSLIQTLILWGSTKNFCALDLEMNSTQLCVKHSWQVITNLLGPVKEDQGLGTFFYASFHFLHEASLTSGFLSQVRVLHVLALTTVP